MVEKARNLGEQIAGKTKRGVDELCFALALNMGNPATYEGIPRWARIEAAEYADNLITLYDCLNNISEVHKEDLNAADEYAAKAERVTDLFDHTRDDSGRVSVELDRSEFFDLLDLMGVKGVDAGRVVGPAIFLMAMIMELEEKGERLLTESPLGTRVYFRK